MSEDFKKHEPFSQGGRQTGIRTARPGTSPSIYSGHQSEDIITGHDHFQVNAQGRNVERRRHPRIPCRSVKACIKTEQASPVIVNVENMSRSGVFFVSMKQFDPGTAVSIAMHYIEGGQNLFQNCRIVRAQATTSATAPNQYAAEFSLI
jgi:hypothetical protein